MIAMTDITEQVITKCDELEKENAELKSNLDKWGKIAELFINKIGVTHTLAEDCYKLIVELIEQK